MTETQLFYVWHQGDSPESASEHWGRAYGDAARSEFDAICENFGADEDVTRTLLVQEEGSREIAVVECKRTVTVTVEMVRSERA